MRRILGLLGRTISRLLMVRATPAILLLRVMSLTMALPMPSLRLWRRRLLMLVLAVRPMPRISSLAAAVPRLGRRRRRPAIAACIPRGGGPGLRLGRAA